MRKLYRSDIAQIVLQETRTDVVRRGNATEWIECLDSIPLPREGGDERQAVVENGRKLADPSGDKMTSMFEPCRSRLAIR